MAVVVSKEVAEAEVNSWLEKKKIFDSIKEQNRDQIDLLVEAVSNGTLTLDGNTFEFTHKLLHPFGVDEKVTALTYKSRLNDRMLKPKLNGVKANDGDARLLAYIAALTDQPRGILEEMDSLDKKIAMAIAIFFL